MVSAWASANHVVLAHVKVEEKSNEIVALPDLLQCLPLAGCVVSIDVVGCQRDIAQQILNQDDQNPCVAEARALATKSRHGAHAPRLSP